MAVTLRDIAKRVNLSHATVSFVINNRMDVAIPKVTRDRVWDAANEMGYRPNQVARALSLGRTNIVGFWLPNTNDSFFAELLYHLQKEMKSSEYEAIVHQGQITAKPAGSHWQVDAALTVDMPSGLVSGLTSETQNGKPVLNIGLTPVEGCDNIVVDVRESVVEAVQHLIDVGCRRIAYLYPDRIADRKDPISEVFDELKKTGQITVDRIGCPEDRTATMALIKDRVKAWGAPEGVFCYSDSLALTAKRAFREIGLMVPKDVALIGCGGTAETEYVWPRISTIEQPIAEIAAAAWSFMRHRIEWPVDQAQSQTFKTKFLPKESSVKFRKNL